MDEGKDEENNNEANHNSWWGGWPTWLQAAKEKSSTAIEFMKRDLTEFSQVVQTDAVAAVSSTAALLREKLTVDTAESVAGKARQSITSVLETITDVFTPQRELEDAELMIIQNSEPVVMDWWQSQLYTIRKDPRTYCHEPEGPPEMYESWLESFDPGEHQDEMTETIMTCSEMREIYNKLVPASVSHLEFWQRYFYRIHLLRKAEVKRADLMRRAEQISIEDVEWEKEELDSSLNLSTTQSIGEKTPKSPPQKFVEKNSLLCKSKSPPLLLPAKEGLDERNAQICTDPFSKDNVVVPDHITDIKKNNSENVASTNDIVQNNSEPTCYDETPGVENQQTATFNNGENTPSPSESLGKG